VIERLLINARSLVSDADLDELSGTHPFSNNDLRAAVNVATGDRDGSSVRQPSYADLIRGLRTACSILLEHHEVARLLRRVADDFDRSAHEFWCEEC
jgi:hypothetical protein